MEKACVLDVRKDSIFACVLNEKAKKIQETIRDTYSRFNRVARCTCSVRLWKCSHGK